MFVRIYLAWVISEQCLYGVYLLKHHASSHQNGWKFYFHKIIDYFFVIIIIYKK